MKYTKMTWLDRNLQRQILEVLMDSFGQPIFEKELAKLIWPDKQLSFHISLPEAQAKTLGITQYQYPLDPFAYHFIQNLLYLEQHGLIKIQDESGIDTWMLLIQITHQGIDFLQQDGGLSAILDIVTIKLHNDTIHTLLHKKIDEAEISEKEKENLKKDLLKIKDSALNTLTENAINAIPATAIIAWLKSALGI